MYHAEYWVVAKESLDFPTFLSYLKKKYPNRIPSIYFVFVTSIIKHLKILFKFLCGCLIIIQEVPLWFQDISSPTTKLVPPFNEQTGERHSRKCQDQPVSFKDPSKWRIPFFPGTFLKCHICDWTRYDTFTCEFILWELEKSWTKG